MRDYPCLLRAQTAPLLTSGQRERRWTSRVATPAEAVGDVPSSASLAVGGLGLCGVPRLLMSPKTTHDPISGRRLPGKGCP